MKHGTCGRHISKASTGNMWVTTGDLYVEKMLGNHTHTHTYIYIYIYIYIYGYMSVKKKKKYLKNVGQKKKNGIKNKNIIVSTT